MLKFEISQNSLTIHDFIFSNQAYAIFLVASAILGFGNAGLGVLSITYIDENVPRNVAAMYIGILCLYLARISKKKIVSIPQ